MSDILSGSSVKDMEKLLEKAWLAGSDCELVQVGRQLGAESLHIILTILGGPSGMQTYIPSTQNFCASIYRKLRDIDICAEYDGTAGKIAEMAGKHNITKSRVRQILAAQAGREDSE